MLQLRVPIVVLLVKRAWNAEAVVPFEEERKLVVYKKVHLLLGESSRFLLALTVSIFLAPSKPANPRMAPFSVRNLSEYDP